MKKEVLLGKFLVLCHHIGGGVTLCFLLSSSTGFVPLWGDDTTYEVTDCNQINWHLKDLHDNVIPSNETNGTLTPLFTVLAVVSVCGFANEWKERRVLRAQCRNLQS